MDSDVGCRSELQKRTFEVVEFVLGVEVEFEELEELVEDFVNGRLYASPSDVVWPNYQR